MTELIPGARLALKGLLTSQANGGTLLPRNDAMNWQDKITKEPKIMSGRPVIKGTRITVEFVLELRHSGWTETDILQSYPHLTLDGIKACVRYADAHGIIAFADWDHELCPEYWERVRSESATLPSAD